MHRRTLLALGAAPRDRSGHRPDDPRLGSHDAARGWWAVRADARSGANPYVAEGQGDGLMLCAQLAPLDPRARTYFDGITRYVLDRPSRACTPPGGTTAWSPTTARTAPPTATWTSPWGG